LREAIIAAPTRAMATAAAALSLLPWFDDELPVENSARQPRFTQMRLRSKPHVSFCQQPCELSWRVRRTPPLVLALQLA
jgi:hypothetical protein